ncbi:MAG: hypothetical protein NTX75_08570 [Proteobacteria bacterium]|nr:hypothetical protein [Pseudomonadota bacterium]
MVKKRFSSLVDRNVEKGLWGIVLPPRSRAPQREKHLFNPFREGKSQSTENQKKEDADICEVLNNRTGFNHAVIRKAALLSELYPFVEEPFCHLC